METNTHQMVSCVVNYAYDASEPDELTIRPGEVIKNVERLSEGWWRGELRGRRGMFPDNFVSVLTEPSNTRPGSVQGRCRAVFSYQPANPDELPLFVGDVLEVLEEVEEGWWRGRRAGRVGVFPSNFVVMLEPSPPAQPLPQDPAPALPPKPVKELCRVLFPYAAVNDDELTLAEGDIVTVVSKDAPDRGWWKGELHGKVGLFPDNFVQLLPPVAQEIEEKKPERPPNKTMNSVYPALDFAKYSALSTSKISLHKENTVSKESSTHSTITQTNKSETEKLIHNESIVDNQVLDSQVKKPPVPLKKSPTPTSAVSGLFSGLKSKMLSSSSSEKTEKTTVVVSSSSKTDSSGSGSEWDRPDGGAASKPPTASNTFDHVERNSILNDPRAARVKAPRRRPPSQALRDDTPQQIGLSNGHEGLTEKPTEKGEEIKPRAREWEKHKAPWMEELKLNQAKKSFVDPRPRAPSDASAVRAHSGSTDRILECGLEEKKSSHCMEMSKSTSSITNRISVIENVEVSSEVKTRHSLDSKKESAPPEPTTKPPTLQSPTAAGRTILTMLDDMKKPRAPSPPTKEPAPQVIEKSPNAKVDKVVTSAEKLSETTSISKISSSIIEKTQTQNTQEKVEKTEKSLGTLERRALTKSEKSDASEATIALLNTRILNLEKLIEIQNSKFTAAIEEITNKLKLETEKRMELQSEIEKLAHCVTQV